MAKSHGFTVEQKAEMKSAYEAGERLKPLAQKWGVSVPTMAKYIRAADGKLRNAGTPKKEVKPALIPNPNGITRDMVPNPNFVEAEINTPQAPVARRILPIT